MRHGLLGRQRDVIKREEAKRWRLAQRMSQAELARRIGVSYVTYSNFERGETQSMLPAHMTQLAQLMGQKSDPGQALEWGWHQAGRTGVAETLVQVLSGAIATGDADLIERAQDLARSYNAAVSEFSQAQARMDELSERVHELHRRVTTQ